MSNVIPFNPKVRVALAVLDAAPDDMADMLGCWRTQDGEQGQVVPRAGHQEYRERSQ